MAKPFFRFADTVGDETGSADAAVNGAVTPQNFYLKCLSGQKGLTVHRLLAYIRDTGSFDAGAYGNGITMANGIEIALVGSDGAIKIDLLDGIPIKSSGDWARQCFDIDHQSFGQGDDFMTVRWTFTKTGMPLSVGPLESIRVTINDDLTDLVEHKFQFQGLVNE